MAPTNDLGLCPIDPADPAQTAVYEELRGSHLCQVVAPFDDMWLSFADLAEHWLLQVGTEVVGSCAMDAERALLGFFVERRFQHRAPALLRLVLGKLQASHMVVSTLDPGFLSSALDVASSVEPHTLLYTAVAAPAEGRVASLVPAVQGDLSRVVDFQEAATGAPRAFLEAYGAARIECGELLLVQEAGKLQATGELRRDRHQPQVVQLGLIVEPGLRGQGLGSRLMCSLVERSRALGCEPVCSTEMSNLAAQRAIERAGFRSRHRILRVGFAL